MTTMKLTDTELTAQASKATEQAAEAQAELGRRQHERMLADREDQRAKARNVLDTWTGIEARITAEGMSAEKRGQAAVEARDFNAAINAFMAYISSRAAKQVVRDAAASAHSILGDKTQIPEVRIYDGTFSQWLDPIVEKVARQEGYDQGRALMGDD